MTDISNLKPGAALTYEQAMALPDGAVVSAVWGYDAQRTFCTVGSNGALGVPKKFGGATLEYKEYWVDHRWHSVRLESLPELPVWVIACERCGTTYKNNERHACVAREPSESSPGEGYRWLVTGVDVLRSGDEWKNQNGKFAPIPVWCVGGVADGAIMFRRRIEPQAEPAKPERQASEIEKRAALALVYTYLQDVKSAVSDDKNPYNECSKFVEAYDYAKSIGAIE